MKISAVIPTYNRQAHVLRAIESILAQTVPVEEIIVVDDGSTDGTSEAITARYGSQVKVLRQKNAGVSAARNRGFREAGCEWIAFLDSDDLWLPAKIERQVEAVTVLGPEYGVCFSNCLFEGHPAGLGSVFEEAEFEDKRPFGPFDQPTKYLLGPPSPFRMQSLMLRRSLLEDIGGFDEGLIAMEDLDVLFRLTFKTKFCFVAEPLVRIDRTPSRPHGLCESFATRNDRKYDDLRRVYTRWLMMPETAGTEYERSINGLLRLLSYDSAECKLHELRIRPALTEIGRLREIGDSYPAIIGTFFSRKLAKMRGLSPAR
jgi:glycosyltransferase involved in cell wall biosynthesis